MIFILMKLPWIRVLLTVILGGAIGAILEWRLLRFLQKKARQSEFRGDDIVVDALQGLVFLFVLIVTVAIAVVHLSDPKVIRLIHRITLFSGLMCVTFAIARMVTGTIQEYSDRIRSVFPSTSLLSNVAKGVVIAFGVLIALQSVGISVTPILTALGVGGVAVALGLQDTLTNLFAGFHIVINRMVRPGDIVRLGSGDVGHVTDITWRNTTVKTLQGNLVIVPNATLASSTITNFWLPDKAITFSVELGVAYGSDLDVVERVTLDVAKWLQQNGEGAEKTFEPALRFHTFADSSINFSVSLRADDYLAQFLLKHLFLKKVLQAYRSNDIEIPFPVRTVLLRQEENSEP